MAYFQLLKIVREITYNGFFESRYCVQAGEKKSHVAFSKHSNVLNNSYGMVTGMKRRQRFPLYMRTSRADTHASLLVVYS